MKRVLKKEEIERLKDAVIIPKDIEAGIVMTSGSFAAIGSTMNLAILIAVGLQQLINENVFDKDIIDTIVEGLEYNKKENSKKELIKKFMKALNVSENDIKEALNEEK